VSGVVEETPGRLEYEVALYKEAPARLTNLSHNSELPVDQAVPIGTKLQLRARINPHSGIYYNIDIYLCNMYTLRRVISLTVNAETFCIDPILTFCDDLNNIRLNFM